MLAITSGNQGSNMDCLGKALTLVGLLGSGGTSTLNTLGHVVGGVPSEKGLVLLTCKRKDCLAMWKTHLTVSIAKSLVS